MSNQLTFSGRGRIDLVEFHAQKHYTIVTTPAPDEFSHPSRFKLVSVNPIGQVGQTVDFTVAIRGTVRAKQYLDKQTGMNKYYQEADVFLEVLTCQGVFASTPGASNSPVSEQPKKLGTL